MVSLLRNTAFSLDTMTFLPDKIKTREVVGKAGKKTTIGYVPFGMSAIQLGSDRNDRMLSPYGLSRLHPEKTEDHKRDLQLVVKMEQVNKLREMEINFQDGFYQPNSWADKNKTFASALKETEHGLTVKVKVHLPEHEDPTKIYIFDAERPPEEWKKGTHEDLTPGSESLVTIKPDNLWFNETSFGVVLKAKIIVVKRNEGRSSFGIEDMIL